MAHVFLNVILTGHLAPMTTRLYRQAVNGKLQMTIDVFLIRLVKPACGFCSTNIHRALFVLIVHRVVVERVTITAPFGKQRLVGMHFLLAVYVIMMGPKLSGPRLEAATIIFVTSLYIREILLL
jgi:hypothetical protein